MIKKMTVIFSLLVMSGCGLSRAFEEAGIGNKRYKTCALHQLEAYSASSKTSERTAEKATEFVISACKQHEETYIVAMTDLAVTITGNTVSREKFLEDEEATLRSELHDMAARLCEEKLK
jgi:hypothetical protein